MNLLGDNVLDREQSIEGQALAHRLRCSRSCLRGYGRSRWTVAHLIARIDDRDRSPRRRCRPSGPRPATWPRRWHASHAPENRTGHATSQRRRCGRCCGNRSENRRPAHCAARWRSSRRPGCIGGDRGPMLPTRVRSFRDMSAADMPGIATSRGRRGSSRFGPTRIGRSTVPCPRPHVGARQRSCRSTRLGKRRPAAAPKDWNTPIDTKPKPRGRPAWRPLISRRPHPLTRDLQVAPQPCAGDVIPMHRRPAEPAEPA